MKSSIILFLALITVFATKGFAQEQVIRSDKTEIINNKKYYIHEVKQGQTIYSICKAYGVEQSDIAMANMEIFEGLKPGQLLKIPFKESTLNVETKIHKVEKGETLYGISKKYKVTVDDLIKWNPELKDGLKNGQDIKIQIATESKTEVKPSVTPVISNKTDTANPSKPAIHIVKEKETVYGISKLYNITVSDIEKNNPSLITNGLKTGDTLVINSALIHKETANNNTHLLFPSQNQTNCNPQPLNRPARIALILPFSEDAEIIEKEDIKLEKDPNLVPQTKPFIEYYEGFLAALDTLRKKGEEAEIFVYDSRRDSSFIASIISSGKLDNMDVVIGPVYQPEFKTVSDYCQSKGIWSVYPMNTKNPLLESNPYVLQFNPSFETQVNQAVLYMASFSDKNYIIAHGETPEEISFIKFYKSKLIASYNANFPGKQVPYSEVSLKTSGVSGIEKAMKDSCDNVVILTSANQATILDLMNKINGLVKYKRVVLTLMPQWKKFEKNIEFDHLFNMQAVTFEPFYINYSSDTIKTFNRNFSSRYKTIPDKYSYLGFDSGIFLITLLNEYGKDFGPCISAHKTDFLQSEFCFEKVSPEGGYENKSIYIIKCISSKIENTDEVKKEYRLTGKVSDKVITIVN